MVWWVTEAYFDVVMVVSKLRFLGKEYVQIRIEKALGNF
jgi:hypothetical protein